MDSNFYNSYKVTVLKLAPCQQTLWWWNRFGPGGCWEYVVLEKYGPWRPAKDGEEGIDPVVEISVVNH